MNIVFDRCPFFNIPLFKQKTPERPGQQAAADLAESLTALVL